MFDARAVARAARRAAPNADPRDVAAILAAVEPLIAATTRHKLMANVAIAVRDDPTPKPPTAGPTPPLSRRQLEMLSGLADGLSRDQVARLAHVSPNTVKTHTQNIIATLNAGNTTHAVALCLRAGWIL